jgi:hypothetical protein
MVFMGAPQIMGFCSLCTRKIWYAVRGVGSRRDGYLKEKCFIGPFVPILVIKCSTHLLELNIFI